MVVGRVQRLVVSLQMAAIILLSQFCSCRPVLVDVVNHTLGIGQQIVAEAPTIGPSGVVGVVERCTTRIGDTLLTGVLPLEESIRLDTAVKDLRQFGKLQVFTIGNEATAVATA